MRYLKRILLTAAVALALGFTAAPGMAQISGGAGGLGGSGGGLGGSGGGLGGTSSGLGGSSGGLGGSSGGLGGSGSSSSGGIQLTTPSVVSAPTAPTGSQGGTVDASNFLGGYYANPYYQGINAMTGTVNPGGFGSALFGTGGGTGGGALGSASGTGTRGATGTRSATAGSTGRTGGATGGTGRGTTGMNNSTNQTGVVIPHPVMMSFPAVARFPVTPVAAPQLQADLTGMFSRSEGMISNPAGIQISVQGNNVTLRGAVKDLEEARLIEGMTRLTPGVGVIKNELTFPVTAGQP